MLNAFGLAIDSRDKIGYNKVETVYFSLPLARLVPLAANNYNA